MQSTDTTLKHDEHARAVTAREPVTERARSAALRRVTRVGAAALRADVCLLGIVDGDVLRVLASAGLPEPLAAAADLPRGTTACHTVAHDPVVICDVVRHPAASAFVQLDGLRVHSYCGVPVALQDGGRAVLCVIDGAPRAWTEDDVAMLQDVAASAASELAAQGASPDLSPYRRMFEESCTALFVLSADGEFVEWNRAAAELLGRPVDQLVGRSLRAFAADTDAASEALAALHGGDGLVSRDVALLRGDGEVIVCTVCARRRMEQDSPVFDCSIVDVTEQKRTEQGLLRSALHDALTGLPNRVVFMDRLERLLRHSRRRSGTRFAVLFLDLDNFKQVNDTHGHLLGDRLLAGVARRLEQCVRQEDTVARIGGDEFAVLLDTVQDAAAVMLVVDRIRESLAAPFEDEGRQAGTSVSVGVALSFSGYDCAEDLLRDADTAMYRAKSAGRNRCVLFDGEMHEHALAQRKLEEDLRTAMRNNELDVHYHPVVELEGGVVTGMEALVRWPHPERGVLLPAEFMPLAEQTGLIVDIGWWVLREACRQLRAWQLDYPHAAFRLTMSVNLSARQFVHPELVSRIDAILLETGLDAHCLRLDLTEAVVMQNAELASTLLNELRERGIQICIDDFGTGYSSLSQLREFPISTFKIDRSFIRQLGDTHEVVQTIIALGRSMAIDAVAEGVETPEQLELLRRLGTRFAQGFLFSLPLDTHAASRMLSQTTAV